MISESAFSPICPSSPTKQNFNDTVNGTFGCTGDDFHTLPVLVTPTRNKVPSSSESIVPMNETSKMLQQHQNGSIHEELKIEEQNDTLSTFIDNGNLNIDTCKVDLPLDYDSNIYFILISDGSKAIDRNRKRKHRPQDCEKWELKYVKAKMYKSNPKKFCSEDAKMIQNWIKNQRSTEMTEEMQKKWLELGECAGISNEVMIDYWKRNKNHPVCQKWAINKKKQRKRLSDREKQWLIINNVLSRKELYDLNSEPLCSVEVIKQSDTLKVVDSGDTLKVLFSEMNDQDLHISQIANRIILLGDEMLKIKERNKRFGDVLKIIFKEVQLNDHNSEEKLQTK